MSSDVPFRLKNETVRLAGLPPGLDGFRIGQITDLHVGAFVTPADVKRAVSWLNDAGVDLQVMTGDLIDDFDGLDETFAALGSNKARHGIAGGAGNHEHWRGI